MGNQFIAVVGPTGAGKDAFLERLERHVPEDRCVFLCDSSRKSAPAPHIRFTTKVTEIVRDGIHTMATPRSRILLFWSRLVSIIEEDVAPALADGKFVFINGFGGTILANALMHAHDAKERNDLLVLHKSMIEHCVIGLGVPPPRYLWLRPSPEVAFKRRKKDGDIETSVSLEDIRRLNDEFRFYGTLPGQTVIQIDADESPDAVFKACLSHIGQDWELRPAA